MFNNNCIRLEQLMKNKSRGYEQLQTVRKIGKIRSTGSSFINGLSNRYAQQSPNMLNEILGKKESQKFIMYMIQLNFKIKQYWPCLFAYYCGYICIPCTFGLSLCVPNICIGEVENVLSQQLKKINHDILFPKKLEMRLVKQCCGSYLLVEEIDFNKFEVVEM